ncbi:MAG: hypothetical protein KF872_06005 [Chitinophagales bacterium]|nr:hypothetical protein [Chitinophagales bacterium]
MPNKAKITVEVPLYLKEWIDNHDISQNALVVMALRRLYREDTTNTPPELMKALLQELSNHKLPF